MCHWTDYQPPELRITDVIEKIKDWLCEKGLHSFYSRSKYCKQCGKYFKDNPANTHAG